VAQFRSGEAEPSFPSPLDAGLVGEDAPRERVGVLLLNLGGPETLDDVQPFLYNLFADPDILRLSPLLSPLQQPLAWTLSTLRAPKVRLDAFCGPMARPPQPPRVCRAARCWRSRASHAFFAEQGGLRGHRRRQPPAPHHRRAGCVIARGFGVQGLQCPRLCCNEVLEALHRGRGGTNQG